MGVVYAAHDEARGHPVAIKTLKHRDPDTLYRLKREFRALADLSHPNLVELYDLVIEDEGAAFVTMELVDGLPFVDYCRGRKPPDDEPRDMDHADTAPAWPGPDPGLQVDGRVRNATRQLAVAVRRLHQAGLVHRDLKPSNVLVTDAERVVVLDFGLVAELHAFGDDSLAGRIVGTVEYMAPEQAIGGEVTPAADWYSVGALAYEALTGRVPHEGTLIEVLQSKRRPPPPPRSHDPRIAPDLDALCASLLAPDPRERPTGDAVLRAFGATTTVVLSTPDIRLTGREEELARLGAALESVRSGSPAATLVRGASGVGKSALMRHLLQRAADDDDRLVVLAGRCYEREAVPYKAMDEVIDHLASYWAGLPEQAGAALVPAKPWLLRRLFPVLARVPGVDRDAAHARISDVQALSSLAFDELRSVLVNLAGASTLVIYIDDVQWIDADSLTLLSALARPPDAPPMLLAMCSRSTENHQLKVLLRQLEIPITTVELGPLDTASAEALAEQHLGADMEHLAPEIARESAGAPFVIEELVRYAHTIDDDHQPVVNVERALATRLERLPEDSRRLMDALALAGEPVSVRIAADVAGLPIADAGAALRRLRSERLARSASDRVEPYHDYVRTHVATRLADAERRAVHRKLAAAYERCDEGRAELLARHWDLAGDPLRASERALDAARSAGHTGDFDRAARSYAMALSLGSFADQERTAIQTAYAEALAAAGHPHAAAAQFAEASQGAPALTSLQLRNRSAVELLRGGHLSEGLAAVSEVLATVGLRLPRSARRALASSLWRRFWLRVRGLRWTDRGEDILRPRDLAQLDIVTSCAVALSNVDYFTGFDFQTRQLAQALRLGEPARLSRAFGVEAGYLATLCATRRAHRLAALAQDLDSQLPAGGSQIPYALWALGAIEYFASCNFEAAHARFTDTAEALRADNRLRGWEMDMSQQYICFAQRYRGQFAWLARTVPRLLREAEHRGDIYATVNFRIGLNMVYLLRDRADLAAHALAEAIADWPNEEHGFQVQHLWSLFAAGAIALYTGAPQTGLDQFEASATSLRKSLLMRVPLLSAERDYLRGCLLLAARGQHAVAQLGGLTKRLSRCKAAIGGAMATAIRAGAAAHSGDTATAAALYDKAAEQFEARGAMGHATAARRHAGWLTGGDDGARRMEQADAHLVAERVKVPARLAALLVPAPPGAGAPTP